MHSTSSVIRFVFILTAIVALILAFMSTALKPIHEANEAIYNKRGILLAIGNYLDKPVAEMSDEEVEGVFSSYIKQEVIDFEGNVVDEAAIKAKGYLNTRAEDIKMKKEKKKADEDRLWPVFKYNKGDDNLTIVSVRGNGLWDEIWGTICLKADLKTIVGASFDHVGETPGLGAEIKDNPNFPKSFIGKEIYNTEGEYVSVAVKKNGSKERYAVDGLTGATVTANGVDAMMYTGLKYYEPYFEKIKK